jgi:AAA domain-containing protein
MAPENIVPLAGNLSDIETAEVLRMNTTFEGAASEAPGPNPNLAIVTPIVKPTSDIQRSELKRKWGIYSAGELKQRCGEITKSGYVIQGLLPERALGIVVGDSGIGKSPLLYQAGICIAAGIPFLGHPVNQGRVLYLDFENGLGNVDEMVTHLGQHLGLPDLPEDLLLWNLNDSPPPSNRRSSQGVLDMIRDVRPSLAIIDSLGAAYPEIEGDNKDATERYQDIRSVMRECETSVMGVHHLRKPSSDIGNAPPPLEKGDCRNWFLQVRGPRALINGADIRLGFAVPASAGYVPAQGGQSEEIALVMRGFGRVRGEIPTTYLARVSDEDGDPLGYRRLTGVALLFNGDQEAAFAKLPDSFRFKEGQKVYGKAGQPTTDFLNKCIAAGIVRKLPNRQGYEKTKGPE